MIRSASSSPGKRKEKSREEEEEEKAEKGKKKELQHAKKLQQDVVRFQKMKLDDKVGGKEQKGKEERKRGRGREEEKTSKIRSCSLPPYK